MLRMHQVSCSILTLVVVATFGLKLAAQTSAAAPANLAKPSAPHSASHAPLVQTYGQLPLSFEANQGQTDASVKFLSRGGGYTLFLTEEEAVLSLHKAEGVAPTGTSPDKIGRSARAGVAPPFRAAVAGLKSGATKSIDNSITDNGPRTTNSVLRMRLVGANTNAFVTGVEQLPGKSNYFIGNDPKKWRTNVPTYAKVRYSGVYPGIDLVYYGNQGGQLEYDFVVAPGADPSAIKLDVGAGLALPSSLRNGGADPNESARAPEPIKRAVQAPPLRLNANGDLILHADGGDIRFQKPVVYQQDADGRKQYIDGRYLLAADDSKTRAERSERIENPKSEISFLVGAYDHTKPLVIDPAIAYSTLLGGTLGQSNASSVAVYTDPVTSHVYAYVAGSTCASDFPMVNPEQLTAGGGSNGNCYPGNISYDAFVTKFDPSASGAASVIYSTYLGGSGADGARGIAVDSAGNAYIAGETQSTDFPLLNAYQSAIKVGPDCRYCIVTAHDAFLTKLSADGSTLMYSTYFGGSELDVALAIALDSTGHAYIAGYTNSPDLPMVNPYQATNRSISAGNAFLAGFDTTRAGSASLLYSTYFGGSGSIGASAVAVDAAGIIHLSGSTTSADLPIVNGFQTTPNPLGGINGPGAGFYAKLNPSESGTAQLVYSTYLGTEGYDGASGVAVDSPGNAYIISNGTVYKINPSLSGAASLVYSTPWGQLFGFGGGGGTGIAVDASGDAFVVGSAGPGMPLVNPVMGSTNGVFQSINAGQSWAGLTQGLTDFPINALAVDVSTTPRTLYAGTGQGTIFSTTDGGLNWNKVFQLPIAPNRCSTPGCVMALAVDPINPSNVYAGTSAGVYKSPDRGATWSAFNAGLSSTAEQQGVMGLTFDGATLYAGAPDGLYILSPAATFWNTTALGAAVQNISIDPTTAPHTIYTAAGYSDQGNPGSSYKSSDGGATWIPTDLPPGQMLSDIAIDTSTSPATLFGYNGFGYSPFLWSSADGGYTWNPLNAQPNFADCNGNDTIGVDTTTLPSTLYVCDTICGIFKSADGGNSLTTVLAAPMGAMALDPSTASSTTPATVYAATSFPTPNAFIAELNPSGSALLFSTYLGGIASNTSGNAIALDASDNIYITGSTAPPVAQILAPDPKYYFPTVNAFQPIVMPILSSGNPGYGFFTKFGNQTLPTNSSGSVTTQMVVQTGTLAITFPSITGSTTSSDPTLTVTPLSSATTANFSLSDNLGAYDISTTAEYSGSVTLCFQALTVNDFSTFSNLEILHIVNGSPVNVTTSYNFSTRTICGAVTSFSPFVLVKGAAGQLNDLVRTVNESNIRHGIQNSFDAKIQNAIGALTSAHNNSYGTVCNLMGAFISSVQAQEGQAITGAEATAFISAANQIKATLGCQ